MPQISQYQNYREFLKDFYREKKETDKSFTYAAFATRAKLGSPNYFKLIADGKKNLTGANIIKFSKALDLHEHEADFFEALVNFNQAKKALEREYYQRRMSRLRERLAAQPSKTLKEFEFEMMSHWLHHAIMILTNVDGFIESPGWISQRLYGLVDEGEVRAVLDSLLALRMIERDGSGKLKQTHRQIKTEPELLRQSALLFYEKLFLRAIEALKLCKSSEREFNTVLVGLSPSQMPELRKRVRAFMQELNDWALENPEPRQVYALGFAGFPLTSLNPSHNQTHNQGRTHE